MPLLEMPRGDYAFAMAASISGYETEVIDRENDKDSSVTIVGFKGRSYEIVRPKEMCPHLLGTEGVVLVWICVVGVSGPSWVHSPSLMSTVRWQLFLVWLRPNTTAR